MATLTLTDEEQASVTWFDISDDALGKLVKKTCLVIKDIPDDFTGMKKIWYTSCVMLLCNLAAEADAETSTFSIRGLTDSEAQNGDWEVTITRKDPPCSC